jgi:crotonobetainyl-CoA:carnitine CoA-transferase CaiB-like acyl-CoA transferase
MQMFINKLKTGRDHDAVGTAGMKTSPPSTELPLHGVRIVEFCHTIMGPSCTLVLADLGATVIKVEPVEGERTRDLKGFGSGYFDFFNRNKQSFAVDIKNPKGRTLALELISRADVLVENFAPGTMDRLKLGYHDIADKYPQLIYCSLKGFLPGPHQERVALDETAQMMSGLAYMTGPSGRPLRAGASVVDIMGGLFGAFAVQAALIQRQRTGRGQLVQSALFETAAFLMGQHLAYAAKVGGSIPPMPERVSAWSVYELFATANGKKVFIGIVSDAQWERFCTVFGLRDLETDPRLATNDKRIAARSWLIPKIADLAASRTVEELESLSEQAGIAFAVVAEPTDLLQNEHLLGSGALLDTRLSDGSSAPLPRLPLLMDGHGFSLRTDPPRVGSACRDLLHEFGYGVEEINALAADGVINLGEDE